MVPVENLGTFFHMGILMTGPVDFLTGGNELSSVRQMVLETLRHALRLPSHKSMLEPAHEQLELGDRTRFLLYFPTDTCINKDICLDYSLYYPQVPMIMMQQGELDKPI